MAGIDDNVAVIGDWAPPEPSPRAFFPSFLGDSFGSRSFSELLTESGNEEPSSVHEMQKEKENTDDGKEEIGGGFFGNDSLESSAVASQKTNSRRGLAERMAGRAGFNDLRLNTARIRSATMSSEVRSPYLTIPPGLSPTTLLDSPVFLSNSLAQQSPTTGKFSFAPNNNRSLMSTSTAADKNDDHMFEDVDTSSFVFKPHVDSSSSYFPTAENKAVSATTKHQSLPSIEVSVQSEHPMHNPSLEATVVHSQNQQKFHFQADLPESSIGKDSSVNIISDPRPLDGVVCNANSTPGVTSEYSPPPSDQQDGEGDQRGEFTSMVGGTSSEDGYNWRKYGQKQVKGSEFPRSYYKCTHPNCQVKKKVERSHEGHITEIIYKGAHNHPKPPPNRRSAVGSSHLLNEMDIPEHHGLQDRVDGDPAWTSAQHGAVIGGPDRRHDGSDPSFASLPTGFCDPSTSVQTQDAPHFESADAIEVSSTLSNGEDEDEQGTHGSMSLGGDGDGDESESKRRKIDTCAMEMSGATRAVREPRVVVQTTSEVDILDDGYRWRKYGQKVVKGNPNPRSYYKCTNAGCTVRKHVERASHDLKSVITTYEGKHNHDVPAARNSSHVSTGSSGVTPASSAQTYMHKPEPSQQVHDSLTRFDGPAPLGVTYGMGGRQQLGPRPGFSFGLSQRGLANLAMAGLGPGQGKLPVMPVHSYLGQHQGGFVLPKGEPQEEPMSDSGLPSNGSSVYHQIMNRTMPLGPQM